MTPSRTSTPWWLQEGTETCELCGVRYWYEVEVRCVDCDRPGCPECMVVARARAETWCRECGHDEEEG